MTASTTPTLTNFTGTTMRRMYCAASKHVASSLASIKQQAATDNHLKISLDNRKNQSITETGISDE